MKGNYKLRRLCATVIAYIMIFTAVIECTLDSMDVQAKAREKTQTHDETKEKVVLRIRNEEGPKAAKSTKDSEAINTAEDSEPTDATEDSQVSNPVQDIQASSQEEPQANPKKEKSYVVVTKSEKAHNRISKKYKEDLNKDNDVSGELLDDNIMVADLTKKEAAELEDRAGVRIVEEDILLKAAVDEVAPMGTDASQEGSNESGTEDSSVSELEGDVVKEEQTEDDETAVNDADANEMEWNYQMIGLEESKGKKKKKGEARIAVLDSGIDMNGEVNVNVRVNLVKEDLDMNPFYQDTTGHGTSVAGIISDINQDAEIVSVRIFDQSDTAPLSRVIEAIYWCVENDIDIINMSFGTSVKSLALKQAVQDAEKAGILMVASAGNGGDAASVEYPAAYEQVIAVGAIDSLAEKTESSAVGEEVELVAPGEEIIIDGPFGLKTTGDGTSFSTPHVTAAASILIQQEKKKVSPRFIRKLMNASAKKIDYSGNDQGGSKYGHGLLDISYALDQYTTFKKAYKEGEGVSEEVIEENSEAIETFDDVNYVEARWHEDVHNTIANDAMAYNGITGAVNSNRIKWIRIGSSAPDKLWAGFSREMYPKNCQWHGNGNYIANSVYVAKVARNNGNADNVAEPPGMDSGDYKKMKDRIRGMNGDDWYKLVKDRTPSQECKSSILWGMALHIVADTYAHRAWVYGKDGSNRNRWIHIVHAGHENFVGQPNKADEIDFYENRDNDAYMAAKWFLGNPSYSAFRPTQKRQYKLDSLLPYAERSNGARLPAYTNEFNNHTHYRNKC